MTALIAWSTNDKHGVASLYLGSDSRISIAPNNRVLSDSYQKTFASNTTPDVFVFCGPIAGVHSLIHGLIEKAEESRLRSSIIDSQGCDYSKRIFHAATKNRNLIPFSGLAILHGFRFGSRRFGLCRMSISQNGRADFTNIPLSSKQGILHLDGSGDQMIERAHVDSLETDAKGFSRWFWQSFVLSLSPSTEPTCGGAPQLVGLFCHKNGIQLGVRHNEQTYLSGSAYIEASCSTNEFRNELFERVDKNGVRLKNAQPHALNFAAKRLFPI